MSSSTSIDFWQAFLGFIASIPFLILVTAIVSIFFTYLYAKRWWRELPTHTDLELREALGDRNGAGSITTAIREAVQKAKDKEAEAKTKTEEAEKATKEKDEAVKKATESEGKAVADLNELLTAIGKMTGHTAPADKNEALTVLREAGSDLRNVLKQLRKNAAWFDSSCRDLDGPVHTILDAASVLVTAISDADHQQLTLSQAKEIAEKKAKSLEDDLTAVSGRNTNLLGELGSLHQSIIDMASKSRTMVEKAYELVEAGKIGDQKKIAVLQAEVKALNGQIDSAAKHADAMQKAQTEASTSLLKATESAGKQIADIARSAINQNQKGGNNNGNGNNGGNGGNRNQRGQGQATTGGEPPRPAAEAAPAT